MNASVVVPVYLLLGVNTAMWVIGWLVGRVVERSRWRDEMIKRKHASYDWMSGKWQWGVPDYVSALRAKTQASMSNVEPLAQKPSGN